MNKNERRGLVRGAALQIVAALAPYSDQTPAGIVVRAMGLANTLVNRIEQEEGLEDALIKASEQNAKAQAVDAAAPQPIAQVEP